MAPRFQALTDQRLETTGILAAKKADLVPDTKWGSVLDALATEVENTSMFGLYQAMTFVASHQLTGYNAISMGNSITEHFVKVD